MSRRPFYILLILVAVFVTTRSEAAEIINAEKTPYVLNNALIDELWSVVVSTVNNEAVVFKVPPETKAPKIVYEPNQPENRRNLLAEIEFMHLKKTGEVVLSIPRVIYLYPYGFTVSPALVYGAIAQEFFHEAMLYQEVMPEFQHCLMISRETLAVAMKFIDLRLGTGKLAQKTLYNVTAAQCTDDMRKLLK